jgi:hypothetical protein
MHTIRQFRSGEGGWVTIFASAAGIPADIQRFTNRSDAASLASYLNGGDELALTAKGFEELFREGWS